MIVIAGRTTSAQIRPISAIYGVYVRNHGQQMNKRLVQIRNSRPIKSTTISRLHSYTVNVKYSTHGVYIEYDILNFRMHNS